MVPECYEKVTRVATEDRDRLQTRLDDDVVVVGVVIMMVTAQLCDALPNERALRK